MSMKTDLVGIGALLSCFAASPSEPRSLTRAWVFVTSVHERSISSARGKERQ